MPFKRRKIAAKHLAGGLDLSTGEQNLKPEYNVQSRNVTYELDGSVVCDGGFGDVGWDPSEASSGIDGLYVMPSYPDYLWMAVNGKIKTVKASSTPQASTTVYGADTGLSLTAGSKVFMKEYRGQLYGCNGTDNYFRFAVGTFKTAYTSGGGTITTGDGEGYKFTNGADKVYADGDEMDYTAVSGDTLTTVTNDSSHAAGTLITQYNTITAPSSGSAKCSCFAFFKETMWIAGMPDERNVLRYGKTVGSLANLVSGHIHNFSDGNNYLIGDGGDITALLAKGERLYVFLNNKIYYIGIEQNSSGVDVFSTERLFSGIHGAPNPFAVCEMGEYVIVFTGKRVVRIGFDPNYQQILPNEDFDSAILPILRNADADQSLSEVFYNEDTKKLRLKFYINGIAQVAVYNNITKNWSYPYDEDASIYAKHRKSTYFGSPDDDVIYRAGLTFDADSISMPRRYLTGRWDGGSRNSKLFLRGKIEGTKRVGNKLYITTYIDNQAFGGAREINDTHANSTPAGDPLGGSVIGATTVGSGGSPADRTHYTYPFVIGRRGKDIRFAITSDEIGSDWTARELEVEYEENGSSTVQHY